VIELDGVNKFYGLHKVINNLSLKVPKGDIFGFIGPNGAGKTTTIRMIVGLLRPTDGQIKIDGHSVHQDTNEVKRLVGYMPDYFGVYPDLLVWEYLNFFAACYNIPEHKRAILIEELLELVDLSHRRNDWVDRLSGGMKQRLSLARTLIHDPQVLVLDEPAAGLDPRARLEMRELLIELASLGKTVFFSTHILADVVEICTRVGIIEAGSLVAFGTLEELHLNILPVRRVEVTLLDGLDLTLKFLESMESVDNIITLPEHMDSGHEHVEFSFSGNDQELSQVIARLVSNNIPILHFQENARDLEHVYLHATKGKVT
jgi:ABC-2 type transport system ATP-binding protein